MSTQPEYRDSLFIANDSTTNFKQIIAKRSDLTRFAGGRLAPSTYGTYVYAGTVLGFANSGGDSGFYKPYNSSNSDGSQVAVGVLSEDAGVDASGNGSAIDVIKSGDLFQTRLIGLDSTAITNMSGKSYTESGVQIIFITA